MPPLNETLHFYNDNAADYAAEASGKIQRKQIFRFSRELMLYVSLGGHVTNSNAPRIRLT